MNKNSKNSVGWLDCKVVLSMVVFAVFMLCSAYSGLTILKYIAIIPAIYGVIRSFARAIER